VNKPFGIRLTDDARRALDAMFPPDPHAAESRAVYEPAVADEHAAHRAAFGEPISVSRHEAANAAQRPPGREEHSHGRRKLTKRARKARG
jgi:hypothetical protein